MRLATVDCTTDYRDLRRSSSGFVPGDQGFPRQLCKLYPIQRSEKSFGVRGILRIYKEYIWITDTAHSIASYLVRQSVPRISVLNKTTDIELFNMLPSMSLIAYLNPDDQKSSSQFDAIVESLHESFIFGKVFESGVAVSDEGFKFLPSCFAGHMIEKGTFSSSNVLISRLSFASLSEVSNLQSSSWILSYMKLHMM